MLARWTEKKVELAFFCPDDLCIPSRATPESAGYDLKSPCDMVIPANTSGRPVALDLQLQTIIPEGYFGKIEARSSFCVKGIDIMAGVIDSDYPGSIKVLFRNPTNEDYVIHKYDRVAQLIIMPHASWPVHAVTGNYEEARAALKGYQSTRTSAGFGSTGV